MRQQSGRNGVVVIQPVGGAADRNRTTGSGDENGQPVGIAIGSGVLSVGIGVVVIERQLLVVTDGLIDFDGGDVRDALAEIVAVVVVIQAAVRQRGKNFLDGQRD